MHVIDPARTAHVELSPIDIFDHVTGHRPSIVLPFESVETGAVSVHFAYNVDSDHGVYADGHPKYTPVLNSKSIKKLLQMDSVHYSHPGLDVHFNLTLEIDTVADENAYTDLKEAFHANHEPYDFGGKDPRRVWNDYEEERS